MVAKKRHMAKAITWRFLGTIMTSVTIYLVSGDFGISLGAGLLDSLVKLFAYYFHERLWYKIKWGVNSD